MENPDSVVIVLDSCRYDYFYEEYRNFLNGELKKVFSPASCTIDWLKAVWPDYYDLTYVSAMPGINSKGVPLKGFSAMKHFKRVIDAWDLGWNEELGTVHPGAMGEIVRHLTDGRNLVIHYAQPHQPYIGDNKLTFWKPKPEMEILKWKPSAPLIRSTINSGKTSLEELKTLYRDNLRLVLKHVADLLPYLDETVLITADHGEFLGENGQIFHPCGSKNPLLRDVPWLLLDK